MECINPGSQPHSSNAVQLQGVVGATSSPMGPPPPQTPSPMPPPQTPPPSAPVQQSLIQPQTSTLMQTSQQMPTAVPAPQTQIPQQRVASPMGPPQQVLSPGTATSPGQQIASPSHLHLHPHMGYQPPMSNMTSSGIAMAQGTIPQHHGQMASQTSQDTYQALQKAMSAMEEKGIQNDPRYSQLLALRARHVSYSMPVQADRHLQGPGTLDGQKHLFSSSQLQQLRVQIMAYRLLARNQPLTSQLALAVQGKRVEQVPQQRVPQQPDTSLLGGMQQPMRTPGPVGGQPPTQSPLPGQPAPSPGQPATGPTPASTTTGPGATVQPQTTTPAVPRIMPQQSTATGSGQTGAPPSQPPQQKQNRVTPITKPAGLDPIIILQERENSTTGFRGSGRSTQLVASH